MQLRSRIWELAQQTANNIRNKQNFMTDKNRKVALAEFDALLSTNPAPSDHEIVSKAGLLYTVTRMSGNFGRRGPEGSTFLKEMGSFLQTSKKIIREQQAAKLVLDLTDTQQILRGIHERMRKETEENKVRVEAAEKERIASLRNQCKTLEGEIFDLSWKHERNSRVGQILRSYLSDVRNDRAYPDMSKKKIKELYSEVHPDIHEKLEEYRVVVETPGLIESLKDENKYYQDLEARRPHLNESRGLTFTS